MATSSKILAIIGARGGSKGLPQKNILDCAGKPLISWTIDAAKESKYINYVVVSTDCEDIAKISKESGANVPFLRPDDLAGDEASAEDVIDHVVSSLEEKFDYFLWLQPTSPLRNSQHIDEAIEQYFKNVKDKNETLVSVYELPAKIGWMLENKKEHYLNFCFEQKATGKRRQELQKYYLPNGAIYMAPIKSYQNSFYTDKTQFYVMSENDSVDIDYKEDLVKAIECLS